MKERPQTKQTRELIPTEFSKGIEKYLNEVEVLSVNQELTAVKRICQSSWNEKKRHC